MGRTHPAQLTPFSGLSRRLCKSLHIFHCFSCGSNNHLLFMHGFDGVVVNNSVFCHSPDFIKNKSYEIEVPIEKMSGNENDKSTNSKTDRESSSSSDFLESVVAKKNDEQSHTCPSESFSSNSNCSDNYGHMDKVQVDYPKIEKQSSCISEIDLIKERFSKLLLGEDMSGSGNGVCTALAISNAITNLCTSVFGQIWRLEPLPHEKKIIWRREMQWLLSVCDHIVELIPSLQTFPDGSKLEVMTCQSRRDLCPNLPALCKLDDMLVELLASFEKSEFWYVEQGIAEGPSSFRGSLPCQEEKWWLPVPQLPSGGLTERGRNNLQQKRDCANQILKAAMAINCATLGEMEVPPPYLDALPKNARACLGDHIHRYITSDQFIPQFLLPCLDLSSEYQVLDMVNRVEASVYLWRRRKTSKPLNNINRSSSKSSWEFVKDLIVDSERFQVLADRAETLLLCLKQRFTGLPQTTLDMCKIQCNKDVGKSILESYSRVLESLAFNMMARIDDLLYVDDMCKDSDKLLSSISRTVDYKNGRVSTPNLSPCNDSGSIAAKEDGSPLLYSSSDPPPISW